VHPNVNAIKTVLCSEGPIVTFFHVHDGIFDYKSGVITRSDLPATASTYGMHAVAIIGWSNVNGVDVAVIRNSWGTNWGMEGYAYFELTDANDSGVGAMYNYLYYAKVE